MDTNLGGFSKPIVSISIITYNHASTICRCIEGALMQKTTFPYEIIIGEDCSTDGTREIITDYALKYPEKIQAILSHSNLGAAENYKRSNQACQGEYIAYCEGDDYWIDPFKLQKQFDAIQKFNSMLVTHSSFVLNYVDGKLSRDIYVRRAMDMSGILDIKDIILLRSHFHTSSFFIRSELLRRLPDWINQSPVGDYPIKVVAAYLGGVYFINEFMSVYQKNTPGSFTNRKQISEIQKKDWISDHERNLLMMYKNLDLFTENKYSDVFKLHIQDRYRSFYKMNGNLDFLEMKKIHKKSIKQIAFLVRPFPANIRNKILDKVISYLFLRLKILENP